jgi:hypothetical protein
MVVATKAEQDKRLKNIESFRKKLDDDLKVPEKQIISAIRSAIRKVWMRFPSKLHFLQTRAILDTNPDTRTKWLYRCEKCQGLFKQADVNVDHRKGENPCAKLEDVASYAQALLGVGPEDLQLLCLECHANKTHAERYNLSEEDAKIDRQVIAIEKTKTAGVVAWLQERGITPGKNAKERKRQLAEQLRKESLQASTHD